MTLTQDKTKPSINSYYFDQYFKEVCGEIVQTLILNLQATKPGLSMYLVQNEEPFSGRRTGKTKTFRISLLLELQIAL